MQSLESGALEPTRSELKGLSTSRRLMRFLPVYGLVILCFMSGVLWGFASKGQQAWPYVLSVLPALWGFFAGGLHMLSPASTAQGTLGFLMIGFAALVGLDLVFQRAGLAPVWWMRLRVPLTASVLACLAVGYLQ